MKNPMVTVIIPMYNCEKTISDTIESVLQQTYSQYEIILVDDGSIDGTVEVCREKLKESTNWKLITQHNLGVSVARNAGIAAAKGEFLFFLDSDDWMRADMLQTLILKQNKENSDLVLCGFTYIRVNGNEDNIPKIYSGKMNEISSNQFYECYTLRFFNAPWNKLFKRKIIIDNSIEFNTSISILEDLMFNLQYMYVADTITIVEEALYLYNRTNMGGLLRKIHYNKDCAVFDTYDALDALMNKLNIAKKYRKKIVMDLLKDLLKFQICISNDIHLNNVEKIKKIQSIRSNKIYSQMIRQAMLPGGVKNNCLCCVAKWIPSILIKRCAKK